MPRSPSVLVRPTCNPLESRDTPAGLFPTAADQYLLVGSDTGATARTWSFPTTGPTNPVVYFDGDSVTPAFEASFLGGVRTALGASTNSQSGPINVLASGPGRPTEVRVEFPAFGTHLSQQGRKVTFSAFEPEFTGGAFVAVSDFSGHGDMDVIVTPDVGGGPRVRVVRNGDPANIVADFLGIDDPNFRGGVRTTTGDLYCAPRTGDKMGLGERGC